MTETRLGGLNAGAPRHLGLSPMASSQTDTELTHLGCRLAPRRLGGPSETATTSPQGCLIRSTFQDSPETVTSSQRGTHIYNQLFFPRRGPHQSPSDEADVRDCMTHTQGQLDIDLCYFKILAMMTLYFFIKFLYRTIVYLNWFLPYKCI